MITRNELVHWAFASALGLACGGTAGGDTETVSGTGEDAAASSEEASAGASSSSSETASSTSSGGAEGGDTTSGEGTDEGGDSGALPPDPCVAEGTCPAGEWIDVTPPELAGLEFGPGPVVLDPDTPSDLYVAGGGNGLWRSSDYGNTWTRVSDAIGYVPMGYVMAVLPGDPPTIVAAGYRMVLRSIDGGETFEELPFDFPDSLYSMRIDPYDPDHLISGLHEVDGIVESVDGGQSWSYVGTDGFPAGGKSWYPFFVDTGEAATTRGSWFSIAQDGGSATRTTDGGASWTVPEGIDGLQHAHGNAQIFQSGDTLFVPGVYGPGNGLYRSDDRGQSFTRILDGSLSVTWGTAKNVYAMWGWACSGCDLGPGYWVAPLPAAAPFDHPTGPTELLIGANHVAVTSDGTHDVFVGTMWSQGIWRYVEP